MLHLLAVSQRCGTLAYTDCPRHTHRHINVPPILYVGPLPGTSSFFRGTVA